MLSEEFYSNGLCKDPYYYKQICNFGRYYVAKYKFNVLFTENFSSLTAQGGLVHNSFVEFLARVFIDGCNKEKIQFFQYIDSNKVFVDG